MADPEDPHPRASFSVPHPPQASSVPSYPPLAFSVPVHPPHPQAFIVAVDPPHPRGRFFMLSTSAFRDILYGTIVAILFFLNICSHSYMQRREFRSVSDRWVNNRYNSYYYLHIDSQERLEIRNYHNAMTVLLPIQIVSLLAIARLYIWASSSRTEMIVTGVFLGALSLTIVFVSLGAQRLDNDTMFTANIVAISWYCIWKLYLVVAKPLLRRWSWAPIEEASWLLLPQQQQATFRIQDLPRQFSPGEIRAMTQDFRTMVGQGGFAQVFRGLLDGTAVAVKRMTTTAGHAEDDDFLREISIVANVHHRSLVRLLGYCLQRGGGGGGNRYLVYPFLENGSLDSWLFHGDGGEGRRGLLPWPTRRRIAVDVAKALAYLDIKPGNILLDGDLRAHVSDFGISMSITPDLSNVDTRGRGTPGYMAPEMMINAVSTKSDVFSYGMTLLELVGGRRNFEPAADDSSATPDFRQDFFPYIVREKMARGELMEAVDAAMALVNREEVETAVKVALSCIQSRWDMRPSMLAVVDMLEGRVAIDLPPESRRQLTVDLSDLRSSLTHNRYI